MYFFDWLSIKQTHILPEGQSLPLVCSVFSSHLDLTTGEEYDTKRRLMHEGSYSTSISIRCDGCTVEVSGNPSRVNRLDNLFGFSSLDDCVIVFNRIIADYGLPPFQYGRVPDLKRIRSVSDDRALADCALTSFAVVTELHVTRNYFVGAGNEGRFYRGLSTFKHRSRIPKLYTHGVTWGEGSRRLYFGFYSKGSEFDLPRQKNKLNHLLLSGKIKQDEFDYYNRVRDYCLSAGIVRLEYKLKSNWLRDNNLRMYRQNITADYIAENYLNIAEKWIESMSVSNLSYNNIAEQLEAAEVCGVRAARVTESVFLRWLHGMDHGLTKSNFYVHRRRLLALGIDIAQPCDVSAMRIHIRTDEISVSAATPPEWYLMPIAA